MTGDDRRRQRLIVDDGRCEQFGCSGMANVEGSLQLHWISWFVGEGAVLSCDKASDRVVVDDDGDDDLSSRSEEAVSRSTSGRVFGDLGPRQ